MDEGIDYGSPAAGMWHYFALAGECYDLEIFTEERAIRERKIYTDYLKPGSVPFDYGFMAEFIAVVYRVPVAEAVQFVKDLKCMEERRAMLKTKPSS